MDSSCCSYFSACGFTINELLHEYFFKDFAEIIIYLPFFVYFLGTPISRKISYLIAFAFKSIVPNILMIKKTKKIPSFSGKHVA